MKKESDHIEVDFKITTEDKIHYATTVFMKNLDEYGIDTDKIKSSCKRGKK